MNVFIVIPRYNDILIDSVHISEAIALERAERIDGIVIIMPLIGGEPENAPQP